MTRAEFEAELRRDGYELREGEMVDVTVYLPVVEEKHEQLLLEWLDSLPPGPRTFPTWEEYEQHLQNEPPELHGHHDVRPRHRRVERVDGPEHERGGQGQAQHAQIPRHERHDLGRGMEPGQPGFGECEQENTPAREQERHPQALAIAGADGGVTTRAEVLGDDGIERADRAHEADEYRGVDAQSEAQRGEIDRRGVAGEHGVHDREGHHRAAGLVPG